MLKLIKFFIMGIIALLANAAASADVFGEPRFSRALEYEIMARCVGDAVDVDRRAKIEICACALAKTQEDGLFPDYDNDEDFWDDQDDFLESFDESASYYAGNPNSCKRI